MRTIRKLGNKIQNAWYSSFIYCWAMHDPVYGMRNKSLHREKYKGVNRTLAQSNYIPDGCDSALDVVGDDDRIWCPVCQKYRWL